MRPDGYQYPIALSRLGSEETSRDPQDMRAISWLEDQPGGKMTVVTPRKRVESPALVRLIISGNVNHVSWRGLSPCLLRGRVLYAWPDRQHLNDLWGAGIDALAVIEWEEVSDWLDCAKPLVLSPGGVFEPNDDEAEEDVGEPLPDDVAGIIQDLAEWASGYDSGLKWNEVDKLKSDLMQNPGRWQSVTPERVRHECMKFGMSPNDANTVADLVDRRQQGKRFNLSHSSYKGFSFKV